MILFIVYLEDKDFLNSLVEFSDFYDCSQTDFKNYFLLNSSYKDKFRYASYIYSVEIIVPFPIKYALEIENYHLLMNYTEVLTIFGDYHHSVDINTCYDFKDFFKKYDKSINGYRVCLVYVDPFVAYITNILIEKEVFFYCSLLSLF
jgi:hypothetical protein